jgi:hypothetical protein
MTQRASIAHPFAQDSPSRRVIDGIGLFEGYAADHGTDLTNGNAPSARDAYSR